MKNHLVTTSLTDTTRAEMRNIFLGDWCCNKFETPNAINCHFEVAPYHWDANDKVRKDEVYCNDFFESMLVQLSAALNTIHDLNWPLRAWRIIVGPWLRRSITILFDRYESVRITTSNYRIDSVHCSEYREWALLSSDRQDFRENYISDSWNYDLFSRIILETTNLNIIYKNFWESTRNDVDSIPKPTLKQKLFPFWGRGIIRKALKKIYYSRALMCFVNFFGKNNSYCVYIPYLPRKIDEILLNFKLSSFPLIVQTENVSLDLTPDLNKRVSLALPREGLDEFGKLFVKLLPELMPLIYIEGFKKILKLEAEAKLPDKPRIIFTTIGIYVNEILKVWIVRKMLKGSKLVVGQHGGEYATSSIHAEPLPHELAVADFYLTWGWRIPGRNTIPVPALKLIGKSTKERTRNGHILIVNRHLPKYCEELSAGLIPGIRNDRYYQSIEALLEGLLPDLIHNTILRLHAFKKSNVENGIPIAPKLIDKFPSLKVSLSEKTLEELSASSKLIIFTYNGTSFLECIGLNKPCLLIADPLVEPISDFAYPIYRHLEDAGIFHTSSQSAINQINSMIADVNAWWDSNEVVSAKRTFCEQFASTGKDRLSRLAGVINSL